MLALNSGRARRAESRCSGARPGEGESEEEGEAECFDTSSRAQKDFDSLGAEGEGERVGKGEGEGNGSKGSQAMEATVDEGGAVDGAEGAAGAAGEEGAAGADQACEAPREPGADAAAGTGGGERAAGSAGEGANRVGPHQGTWALWEIWVTLFLEREIRLMTFSFSVSLAAGARTARFIRYLQPCAAALQRSAGTL